MAALEEGTSPIVASAQNLKDSRLRLRRFGKSKDEMDLRRSYDRVKVGISDLFLSDGLRAKAMRGGTWLGCWKRC